MDADLKNKPKPILFKTETTPGKPVANTFNLVPVKYERIPVTEIDVCILFQTNNPTDCQKQIAGEVLVMIQAGASAAEIRNKYGKIIAIEIYKNMFPTFERQEGMSIH